jgi:hypothetical protein
MKMAIFLGWRSEKINTFCFYSKSPLLDVGGFAKQGIKKYSPNEKKFTTGICPLGTSFYLLEI